jgi:hypothetical protein
MIPFIPGGEYKSFLFLLLRDRGECVGDGVAGKAAVAVLHGRADGEAIGGVAGGEGEAVAFGGA